MTKYILNDKTFHTLSDELLKQPLDNTIIVEIHPAGDVRRLEQNALYWMWVSDLAMHNGEDVPDTHAWLTEHILAPLYMENPCGKKQVSWANLAADLSRAVRDLVPWEAKEMERQMMLQCSTTWMTVKQFTEYLNRVERHLQSKQVRYRHPDDVKL